MNLAYSTKLKYLTIMFSVSVLFAVETHVVFDTNRRPGRKCYPPIVCGNSSRLNSNDKCFFFIFDTITQKSGLYLEIIYNFHPLEMTRQL